jgi:tRNA(Ile)-lysidine synthase
MPNCVDPLPVTAAELPALFAGLRGDRAVALAVSGGSDSMGLMVLFADWLAQENADPAPHVVLTVDHGLRAQSAAEALAVAGSARKLGFQHAILPWSGPKPRTGLQAAAREARYRLMGEYMAGQGIGTLLLAHTRDDQAETLLMRLARGSGLDGLAAMAPISEVAGQDGSGPLRLVRPLLGIAKDRLQATLKARGVSWVEDPSNADASFERARWRANRVALEAAGLAGEALATSAARLRRARAAVEAATDALCDPHTGLVWTDPSGFFDVDRGRLRSAPEEIALRVIGRCIAAAGGAGEPVPLSGLETIVAGLLQGVAGAPETVWTLARARIAVDACRIRIDREPGRTPLPVAAMKAGSSLIWDGRFRIEADAEVGCCLEVRALGRDGLRELKRAGRPLKGTPVLLLVPSLWSGERLVAVPTAGYWAEEGLARHVRADFLGLPYNSPGRDKPRAPDLEVT